MLPPFPHLVHRVPGCPSALGLGRVTRTPFLPSSDSQSCWEDGSVGRARALYSNTTELEMIWLLKATCRVTRPVSWAESKRKTSQGGGCGGAWTSPRPQPCVPPQGLEEPLPSAPHGLALPGPAHSSRPKCSAASTRRLLWGLDSAIAPDHSSLSLPVCPSALLGGQGLGALYRFVE